VTVNRINNLVIGSFVFEKAQQKGKIIKHDFKNSKIQPFPCHEISELCKKNIYVGEMIQNKRERATNGIAKAANFSRLKSLVILVIQV